MSTPRQPVMSVGRMVLLAGIIGFAAVMVVVACSDYLPVASDLAAPEPWVVLGFVGMTLIGQLAYVKVRHGTTDEELTFFDAVFAAGILVIFPVRTLIVATLVGVLISELGVRRPAIKLCFNLSNYAASTSAMALSYSLLNAGHPRFSWQSMLALVIAGWVFAAVNLAFIALLFWVTASTPPRTLFLEEWRFSAFTAVGSVGIGAVAVALAAESPALAPFAALPVLTLSYAYAAAAQHAEERERNTWLIALGGELAKHGQGGSILDDAATAIARIVGAPEHLVLGPGPEGRAQGPWASAILASPDRATGPRPLAPHELPPPWRRGYLTPLDLGGENAGALLVGSRDRYRKAVLIMGRSRGWDLLDTDAPVLGALVAALGSALRAGATFDALTQETAKLTAVVDNTSDGIAMLDETGAVRLWSQTMTRMTGIDAAQAELSDDSGPEVVRVLVEASRASGDGAPAQAHLVREDGEELDVTVSTVRVRAAMGSSGADGSGWVRILTVHDETRERRVERMKTDFVATISHELRTPITPIKGYAHLLVTRGDQMTPEKRAQVLKTITDNANHLDRLVEDLLMASRVSGGARLAIQMETHDLGDVVSRAMSSFPHLAPRITLTAPAEPIEVQCDPTRARQCLTNLIGNAGKYAPAGSPIDITVGVTGMHAQVRVRDYGPGIPASEREKVFERFYRREDPFTMRTGGAGLGLHIAREFAVAMGGGLTLEAPREGPGAEFVLHLLTSDAPPAAGVPLAAARDQGPARSDSPPPGAPAGGPGTDPRRLSAELPMAPPRDGTIAPEGSGAAQSNAERSSTEPPIGAPAGDGATMEVA